MYQGKALSSLKPLLQSLKQGAYGFTFSLQTLVLKYVKPVANISSVWDVHTNSGILA